MSQCHSRAQEGNMGLHSGDAGSGTGDSGDSGEKFLMENGAELDLQIMDGRYRK